MSENWWVQGTSGPDRELLDAAAFVSHLVPEGAGYAFLAGHRHRLFADDMFADLFKSMQAQTPIIEEGREFLGLILVGAWTVFLTVSPLRPGSE